MTKTKSQMNDKAQMLKKWLQLLISACFFIPVIVFANDLTGLNYLEGFDLLSGPGKLRVVIGFKDDVININPPVLYEKSIQMDLKNTYINPPKRVFAINNSLVDRIITLQYATDTVRVRIMFGKFRIDKREDIKIKDMSNRIVIDLNTPPGYREDILAPSSNTAYERDAGKAVSGQEDKKPRSETEKIAAKPEDAIKKETLIKDEYVHKEADLISLIPRKDHTEKGNETDIYKASAKIISSMSVILSGIFITFFIVKRYLLKGDTLWGKGRTIKVLATCSLWGKNSIALVDVAGRMLVVGVSNNSISLLTTLKGDETADMIGKDYKRSGASSGRETNNNNEINIPKIKEDMNRLHGGVEAQTGSSFDTYLDAAKGVDRQYEIKKIKDESISKVAKIIQNRMAGLRGDMI